MLRCFAGQRTTTTLIWLDDAFYLQFFFLVLNSLLDCEWFNECRGRMIVFCKDWSFVILSTAKDLWQLLEESLKG